MNDLDKEIAELKQFIIDLKADRSATKQKEQRERILAGWKPDDEADEEEEGE